jgi:hypothetical protein
MVITPFLPNNLNALFDKEEQIRTASILAINGNAALKDHIELIQKCLNMLLCVASEHKLGASEEEQVIYGLGIRLFNSTASALKLSTSGYHQGAISFLRDIVEIGFLLDYFKHNPSSMRIWKNSTDNKERKQFRPVEIRNVLDKRDGHQEKKREAMYSLLSKHGTHATFDGFQLISQNNNFVLGPFESEKVLKALVEEACKVLPYVIVIYITHWQSSSLTMLKQKYHFLKCIQKWWLQYMKSNFDELDLEEIATMIAKLEKLQQKGHGS